MRNEDRLRALGAYADQGKWWALRVLEADDSVLFQGRSSTAGDLFERWLTEKDVAELFRRLARQRTRGHGWREAGHVMNALGDASPGTLLKRLRRHSAPLPRRLGTNYEDVMRALGHLADAAGWHDLRLLELDGGVLLQGRPSCVPDALVLASRELTDGDLGEILRASYARRRLPWSAPLPTPPSLSLALHNGGEG
jgi:hypothetical protein